MLKSRISLGRKRKHRPPGRREKGETLLTQRRTSTVNTVEFSITLLACFLAEKSNSTFYNIPSVLQQPPQDCSPSNSPQPAVFSSSVFYARPSLTDSQTLSQSLGSVTEKVIIHYLSVLLWL